jgi:SWIM zinc finger
MKKRPKATVPIDRAAEYVDSPMLTRRLRHGRDLSARVDGRYGIYGTRARIGSLASGSSCSCPSEGWPCKHVRALQETWKANPGSFVDLDELVEGWATKRKTDLLRLIVKMAMVAPDSLSACGVEGFGPEDDMAESDESTH